MAWSRDSKVVTFISDEGMTFITGVKWMPVSAVCSLHSSVCGSPHLHVLLGLPLHQKTGDFPEDAELLATSKFEVQM